MRVKDGESSVSAKRLSPSQPEGTVHGGAKRRQHESEFTAIDLNRGGRNCPILRSGELILEGESVPSGLVSYSGEDPGLRRDERSEDRLHAWAGSRGPPLQGSWEEPMHKARASLPTSPTGRRLSPAKDCPLLWRPSSGPPKRRLSLSQPEGTILAGAIRRNHEANPSAMSQAEKSSQSPERAATPCIAQGTAVERKRDDRPWVWSQDNLRVLKGRFSGEPKGGNTNPTSRRST